MWRRTGYAALCLLLLGHDAYALVFYRISRVTDFVLPEWSIGDGDINSHMDLCVYTTLLGPYTVTVSSAGGYVVKTSNGLYQIPYSLRWDDGGAGGLGGAGAQLSNNVPLSGRARANGLSADCNIGLPAGANARLSLKITQADMMAARSGNYSGSINIKISGL